MATQLSQSVTGDGDQLYYDPGFCNSIEYLIPYLILNTGNSTVPLVKADNLQAKYDFYRILAKKTTLQRCFWWITLRMNGYVQPSDYLGDRDSIIIPDTSYLGSLLVQYKTINPVA